MSKIRSYDLSMTITGRVTLTEQEEQACRRDFQKALEAAAKAEASGDPEKLRVAKVIRQIAQVDELTDDNFDEVFARFIRAGLRRAVRDGDDFDFAGIKNRSSVVGLTPRGAPKMDTTEIAKAAWPFPASK